MHDHHGYHTAAQRVTEHTAVSRTDGPAVNDSRRTHQGALIIQFPLMHSSLNGNVLLTQTEQEAQLSQGDRATLRVTEYLAKSLKVIRNDTVE